MRRHPLLAALSVAYLAVVAWVTLGPQPVDDGAGSLLARLLGLAARHPSTAWLTYDRLEFGANVAMFVPVGLLALLVVGRRHWPLAVLAGVALTIGIETAQLFLPGRVSDIRDVESNSIGTVLGVAVGVVATLVSDAAQRGRPDARRRRRSSPLTAR